MKLIDTPTPTPLIFDFGNVVAFFSYARACEELGKRVGLSGQEFLDRLAGKGFHSVVAEYERGGLTTESFCAAAIRLIEGDPPVTVEEFAAAWSDIFWLNEPVARLVRALRQRRHVLVLGSNTNELHARRFRVQFAETLASFDQLVLSYEIHASKPSSLFYQACVRACGADRPQSCVFIDDMAENVEGARRAGLQAIQFVNLAQLRADLEELGVSCPELPGEPG